MQMQRLTFVLIGIVLIFNVIFEGLERVKMLHVFVPLFLQLFTHD